MKKFVLLVLTSLFAMASHAQYRDVKLPEVPKTPTYKDYTADNSKFWWAVDADGGSSIMDVQPNMQYVNLLFTAGYRVSEYLRLGAGVGTRIYVHNADIRDNSGICAVPIFANARGNFISAYDRDGVPFWSVNIGGIPQEGIFLNPTLGYSFGGLRNTFNIGVSYTLATFKDFCNINRAYSYFGLKLGYEF